MENHITFLCFTIYNNNIKLFLCVNISDVVKVCVSLYYIQWHPNISYVFASVAKDGRLELWDLIHNQMDACV